MKPGQQSWTPEAFQEIVEQHYLTDSGKIRSYGTPENEQYLLESTGLYMEWLDEQQLNDELSKQVETVEREFLVKVNGDSFLSWVIEGKEKANSNAWIDDARVAEYLPFGQNIIHSIEKNQMTNGMIADFYDWEQQQGSNRVVLSYGMSDIEGLNADAMEQLYQQVAATEEVFYDEYYDIEESVFEQADEVHMVDQLLIALELEKLGLENERFWEWLQQEWDSAGAISGRYDRGNLKGNGEESGAVYGIAAELAYKKGNTELSEQWGSRGQDLVYRETGNYDDVHFFDLVWNAPR